MNLIITLLKRVIDIEVPKDDQFDPYFTFFDFKATQEVDSDDDDYRVELGRKLHITHVPACPVTQSLITFNLTVTLKN